MRAPQDSTGRAIGVGDRVSWRGQIYTIKSFALHVQEVPDEIAVDLVEAKR